MGIRIDTSWKGITCNVVTEDMETIGKLCRRLGELDIHYTLTPSDAPVNDNTGLVEIICDTQA